MTELYSVLKEGDMYEKVKELSSRHIAAPTEILRTKNGKPYFKDNPLFFSLTHSGRHALVVFCDKPVGVDLETFKKRTYGHIISRFSERERAEICDERSFLSHWTVREAFIKMKGGTIAEYLKRLEYHDGKLYLDDAAQDCRITMHVFDFGIAAVCSEQ